MSISITKNIKRLPKFISDNDSDVRVYLFVSRGCPYCRKVKSFINSEGYNDRVEIIEVDRESRNFLINNNIETVPAALFIPVDDEPYIMNQSEYIIRQIRMFFK